MSGDLLGYYSAEYTALTRLANEFAQAHPQAAARLRMLRDQIDDPHVERLLQGVAFMGARVQQRLDDEFPELTDAMLGALYPHYLAPFPSCMMVQLTPKPGLQSAQTVPRGTMVETDPIDGTVCRFRTTAPVTLWPIRIDTVQLSGLPLRAPANPHARNAAGVLRIALRCTAPDMTFEKLGLDHLRLYLRGGTTTAQALHELICAHAISIAFADGVNHAFDCPEPWSLMYDPKDMVLPKHRTQDLDRRPWWHKASLEGKPQLDDPAMLKFRAEGSRVPHQTDAQLAEMTANYYGMISQIDHNVGRIMSTLEAAGVADNTLVIYTTDHGELLGNHGLYLKGPTPYEDLLRVTMVARGPGVASRQLVVEPVSTLDLAATFYETTGVAKPTELQSRSLVKLLRGGAETRDVAYSEWHLHPSRCGVALKLRTVRTKKYKCTFELESGAGELYDLANDPAEMNNLFDDAGYAAVRQELHDMMRARPGAMVEPLAEPIGMA